MKIFISYRRQDMRGFAEGLVGRMVDRLAKRFGRKNIFIDVEKIPPGVDFKEKLAQGIDRADVVVVVIGSDWITILRQKALQQEDDYVLAEIEYALQRTIPVVPLLVDEAAMPAESDLPSSLQGFAFRNAYSLATGRDFDAHMDRLIAAIGDSDTGYGQGVAKVRRIMRTLLWCAIPLLFLVIALILTHRGAVVSVPEPEETHATDSNRLIRVHAVRYRMDQEHFDRLAIGDSTGAVTESQANMLTNFRSDPAVELRDSEHFVFRPGDESKFESITELPYLSESAVQIRNTGVSLSVDKSVGLRDLFYVGYEFVTFDESAGGVDTHRGGILQGVPEFQTGNFSTRIKVGPKPSILGICHNGAKTEIVVLHAERFSPDAIDSSRFPFAKAEEEGAALGFDAEVEVYRVPIATYRQFLSSKSAHDGGFHERAALDAFLALPEIRRVDLAKAALENRIVASSESVKEITYRLTGKLEPGEDETEVRNAGITLEAKATIESAARIKLDLVLTRVAFDKVGGLFRNSDGVYNYRPSFFTEKIATTLLAVPNDKVLLATMRPLEPAGDSMEAAVLKIVPHRN